MIFDHRHNAADRVFRIAVALASSSVVHAARGPSSLAAKLMSCWNDTELVVLRGSR